MTFAINGPGEIVWLDLLKKKSKKFRPEAGDWTRGFEGETGFFLRGIVTSGATSGTYTGTLIIGGLICREACLLVDKKIDIAIPIVARSAPGAHFGKEPRLAKLLATTRISQPLEKAVRAAGTISAALPGITLGFPDEAPAQEPGTRAWNYSPQEARGDFNLLLAILFGFIAGIILNAMPCVLPVLGIKILSFAQGAESGRRSAMMRSLAFSAGVIAVFMLLAALASFANYSWGRQFQDPRALVAIITLIVVFSLGMFNVFLITVPGSIANLDNRKQPGMAGDFFKGIFATILATPCSGPFLGAVLAWSVTQPSWVIFTVYGSIGVGMSFPYIFLSANKRLAKILPKPGAWMDDFKKIMGFLLLGFAVYLMLGLPGDLIVPTVLFCVLVSLAVVMYGRIAPWGSNFRRKAIAGFIALCVAAGAWYLSFMMVYPSFSQSAAAATEAQDYVWQEFNADSLVAAHKQGRPAIVDFTANWCMNCQYNYLMVLTRKEIVDLIKEKNVLALKVDMTTTNPVQDSLLRSLGSQSIPFLALFPGDNPYEPVVMRDVLTKGKVRKALEGLR